MPKQNILKKTLLLVVLAVSFMLSACNAADKRSVTLVGYNYTERPIFSFSVDGVGGGNAFAGYKNGGGGWVCCTTVVVGKKVKIDWEYSYTKEQYDAGVREEQHSTSLTVPQPESTEAGYLEVHFYPDNHVELALVKFPGMGKWPPGTDMDKLE